VTTRTLITGIAAATLAAAGGSLLRAEKLDSIKPMHATHAEMDLDCATCHGGVAESSSYAEIVRPDHDICADCHEVDDLENCGYCHTNPDEPAARPPLEPMAELFGHAVHTERNIDCAVCHGERGTEPHLPAKATCRSCHPTAAGLSDCAVCHGPGETRRPISHQPQWLSLHGAAAHADEQSCANCHTPMDCEDCHAGDNVRPRSHTLNYVFEHAVDARANALDCATCHVDQTFCSDCHVAENVLPENHSRVDWVLDMPGGGRHADAARFELETCVACHDAGTSAPVCAECHGR
jgi:hypothetical protein